MSPEPAPITDVHEAWEQHRRRVIDIGYRMLGSVADAEDIAQETFARLAAADLEQIDDVLGWLVTVSSRLSVDHLRRHEHSRRAYVGPWLPEPVVGAADDIADRVTLDDSVRLAMLVVLDKLTPAERAAFILHDVFSLSFREIGDIVGRSPAACRQLAVRARRRVRDDPDAPTADRDREEHRQLANRFATACRIGDFETLVSLFTTDAVGDFDSGGLVPNAPLGAIAGARSIAEQLVASVSGLEADFTVADVNGDPGVIITAGNRVLAVVSLGVGHGQIGLVHAIGNPEKLRHLNRPG